MSLPPAAKDVSSHPAANSVVDPVNKQAQAADVDRKLRFYGVVHALSESKMPTNKQIDDTLDYVLSHSPVDVNALSPEGQKLIQDSRDIIETAKLMVKEKNADELFQNFMWHTRAVDTSPVQKDPTQAVPVDKEKLKNDGQQAVHHLRTLLSLIVTNSEVRKLFSDFAVIGRDLLARGAIKVAEKTRPDEDRLRTVDDTAPSDQFVSEGGRIVGPDETPVSICAFDSTFFFAIIHRDCHRLSRHACLVPTNLFFTILMKEPLSSMRMGMFRMYRTSPTRRSKRRMSSQRKLR